MLPVTPSASVATLCVFVRHAVASSSARYTSTWRHIPDATARQPWITAASMPGVSGPAEYQFVFRRSASITACTPGPDDPGLLGARPSARVTAPGHENT